MVVIGQWKPERVAGGIDGIVRVDDVMDGVWYLYEWGHDQPDPDMDRRLRTEYDRHCAEIEREMRDGTMRARLDEYEVVEIVQRYGGWAVTDYGIQSLYCYSYCVEKADALYPHGRWLKHLAEKDWIPDVALADFALCQEFLRNEGRKK